MNGKSLYGKQLPKEKKIIKMVETKWSMENSVIVSNYPYLDVDYPEPITLIHQETWKGNEVNVKTFLVNGEPPTNGPLAGCDFEFNLRRGEIIMVKGSYDGIKVYPAQIRKEAVINRVINSILYEQGMKQMREQAKVEATKLNKWVYVWMSVMLLIALYHFIKLLKIYL